MLSLSRCLNVTIDFTIDFINYNHKYYLLKYLVTQPQVLLNNIINLLNLIK